jgi:hypothetical protein
MKSSWVMTAFLMWVVIAFFVGIAEQRLIFDITVAQSLGQPTGTDFDFASLITKVWSYMKVFINMLFLYPDFWTGYWIWFYVVVCMPIMVGLTFGIVTILRGTSST